jgi:hypothetical protein
MSKNQDLGELINGIKSLGTNQLNAPAYTSATSFTGTLAGLLGFDSSGNIITTSAAGGGVTSFNSRTGAVTLSSSDVTGALGFTPYNATNPSGFISGINSGMVTSALGYTPVPPSRTLTINGVTYDLSADRSWTVSGSGVITGSGTNNYVTKWTGTTSIGNSNIQDSSTLVSINSETYVNGLLSANKLILYGGPEMIRMYASTPFISFYDATNVTRFGFIQAYAGRMDIVAEASNPLNFDVGGASRMRILTNGNVGIGTIAPVATLSIPASTSNSQISTGSIEIQSYTTNNSWIGDNMYFNGSGFVARNTGYTHQIYFGETSAMRFLTGSSSVSAGSSANATERMRILADGRVGINTTSPYSYVKLHVANGFRANAGSISSTGTIEVYNSGGSNNIYMDGNLITLYNQSSNDTITMNAFGINISGLPSSNPGSGYLWQDGSGYLRIGL